MKGYPLIYSRTKNFDFVPDFLARPKDLNWRLALKYVKNAIDDLDLVQGIRYTAFSVDDYCVCGGIACISSRLIDKIKASSIGIMQNYSDIAEYLRDCKGRNIACFIGIAIPKSEVRKGVIPDISLERYWEIYLQYLKHQWFSETETHSEEVDSPSIDISEKRYIGSFVPQKEVFGNRSVITNYSSHEQQTLDYFFNSIFSGNGDSFITEIRNRREWDSLNFKNAAVDEQLYRGLKSNPVSTPKPQGSLLNGNNMKSQNSGEITIKRTAEEPEQKPAQKKTKESKKGCLIGAAVALIVIVSVLILLKIKKVI